MKTTIALTTLLIVAGSAAALAQGSRSGTGGGGLPSGTAPITGGGAGMPGGVGPGNTTPVPNLPSMTPSNPTVGAGGGPSSLPSTPGGSGQFGTGLTNRPSSLVPSSRSEGPTGSDGLPVGTPRVMVPERR